MMVKLAQNWTNMGLFQIKFQNILAPKCIEIWSGKVLDLSHFGLIWPSLGPNLTSLCWRGLDIITLVVIRYCDTVHDEFLIFVYFKFFISPAKPDVYSHPTCQMANYFKNCSHLSIQLTIILFCHYFCWFAILDFFFLVWSASIVCTIYCMELKKSKYKNEWSPFKSIERGIRHKDAFCSLNYLTSTLKSFLENLMIWKAQVSMDAISKISVLMMALHW